MGSTTRPSGRTRPVQQAQDSPLSLEHVLQHPMHDYKESISMKTSGTTVNMIREHQMIGCLWLDNDPMG
eukprot:scaffold85071_cov23-Tisochrysis_lutea.AAC.1